MVVSWSLVVVVTALGCWRGVCWLKKRQHANCPSHAQVISLHRLPQDAPASLAAHLERQSHARAATSSPEPFTPAREGNVIWARFGEGPPQSDSMRRSQ